MALRRTPARLDLAEEAATWFKDAQIGEAYDYDIPDGVTDEDVRRALIAAAGHTLGRQLRIQSYTEDDGRHWLRVYITNIPFRPRKLRATSVAGSFENWDFYDDLVRKAQIGETYEASFPLDVAPASVLRQIDSASRRVHQRRAQVAFGRDADALRVHFTITDTPALPPTRRSRSYTASLAERGDGWRPRVRKLKRGTT